MRIFGASPVRRFASSHITMRLSALNVAGLVALLTLVAAFGYFSATHTVDVPVYQEAGAKVWQQDYDIYPAVADGAFRYTPATAWLFVPLSFISVEAAAALIFAAKILALVLIPLMVVRLMAVDRRHALKVGLIGALAAGGYLVEDLRTGNIHLLVLFLVVLAMYLVERGRGVLPGVLLALAIALKVTPLLFGLPLLLRKRWATCASTAVALVAVLALPAVFAGTQANRRLLAGFMESATQRLDESRNQSLRGVLSRTFTESDTDRNIFPAVHVAALSDKTVTAVWVVLSGALLVGLAGLLAFGRHTPGTPVIGYALTTAGLLVLSPHSLRMYFSMLFFPLCVLVALLAKRPDHPSRWAIRLVVGGAFLFGSLAPLVLPGRSLALAYEARSPHFVVALAVSGVLAWLLWSHAREAGRHA